MCAIACARRGEEIPFPPPHSAQVMQKLKELGLVDVLYTSNGKEYLTPKQLRLEVGDEIMAHGGRINITELAPILNVDLPHVERAVDDLLHADDTLQLFRGESRH
jgi:Mn-dependent DtxR family transcriptional regulator